MNVRQKEGGGGSGNARTASEIGKLVEGGLLDKIIAKSVMFRHFLLFVRIYNHSFVFFPTSGILNRRLPGYF